MLKNVTISKLDRLFRMKGELYPLHFSLPLNKCFKSKKIIWKIYQCFDLKAYWLNVRPFKPTFDLGFIRNVKFMIPHQKWAQHTLCWPNPVVSDVEVLRDGVGRPCSSWRTSWRPKCLNLLRLSFVYNEKLTVMLEWTQI